MFAISIKCDRRVLRANVERARSLSHVELYTCERIAILSQVRAVLRANVDLI